MKKFYVKWRDINGWQVDAENEEDAKEKIKELYDNDNTHEFVNNCFICTEWWDVKEVEDE